MATDPISKDQNKSTYSSASASSESPLQTTSKKVMTLGSRLRVVEERYNNLRKKIQLSDESLMEFEKELRGEFKDLSKDFLDIKKTISNMNENLINMASEMQSTVKSQDFKVLQKYVDIWQPMNFITRNDLKSMIKDLKD